MMPEFFYIFIPVIIQGSYDFAVWYGMFKEQSGHKYEWLYRVIKETLDIPVTACLLYFVFHWNVNLIAAFFILKWFGFCDAWYILIWKFVNPIEDYTAEGIWWLSWTPLGILRSWPVYNPVTKPKELYFHVFGNLYIKKGILSLIEFQYQLAVGLIVAFVINQFELITKLIGLF